MSLVTCSRVTSPPHEDCFCLDPLDNGESVVSHEKHMFHERCLKEWTMSGVQKSDCCPYCLQKIDVSSFFPWTEKICAITKKFFSHALFGAIGLVAVASIGQKEWTSHALGGITAAVTTGVLKGKEAAREVVINMLLRQSLIGVTCGMITSLCIWNRSPEFSIGTFAGIELMEDLGISLKIGIDAGITAAKIMGISGAIGVFTGFVADRNGLNGGGIMSSINTGGILLMLRQIAQERETLDSIIILLASAMSGISGIKTPFSVDPWQIL